MNISSFLKRWFAGREVPRNHLPSQRRRPRRRPLALECLEDRAVPSGVPELVKDIWPGPPGSNILPGINVNGTLFFVADDGVHGWELWKSNGSATGTVLVKDIDPGPDSNIPSLLTNVNGTLFFTADDGVHGKELWKSDGTEAGTVLVKDINPGPNGSGLDHLTDVNSTLFFLANDGVHGGELWKSDGTEAGTVLVKDINPGPDSSTSELHYNDGIIPKISLPDLTNVNGTLFFTANDGVHGGELWKSNGTAEGTVLVKDIRPGSDNPFPTSLTDVNGTLFFLIGFQLWKSDGTEVGTVLVKGIPYGTSRFGSIGPGELTNINGTLFFTAFESTTTTTYGDIGTELWKSDGTAEGTVIVKHINPNGSNPTHLTDVNGTLFFAADDGVHGKELWKSDGTEAGTVLVKDLTPGPDTSHPFISLENVNGTLFFLFGFPQEQLWKSDGTEAGTVFVMNTGYYPAGLQGTPTASVNDTLFFVADDGVHGRELWKAGLPLAYGAPGWIPLVGDWDGDGTETIGAFDPATATWYLRNSNSRGAPDIAPFRFGAPGWVPVVGDWDGDGIDTIGVFDPTGQFGQAPATWYLRNSNSPGAPDLGPFAYGAAGWTPVVGDWDGDGVTTIGVFDQLGQYGQPVATWYLRNANGPGAPDLAPFQYGATGWLPVVGDWDGDGTTTIGVFDSVGQFGRQPASWFLKNSNIPGAPDVEPFAYGAPGWVAMAGDWDGDGLAGVGIFDPFGQYGQQPATWYLL